MTKTPNPKAIGITTLFCLIATFCWSQATTVYTDVQLHYKKGIEHYDKGLFGLAQEELRKFMSEAEPSSDPDHEQMMRNAELHYAKSAVRLNLPEGEKLVLDFARTHAPLPIANKAIIEMANYYYNDRNYDKALELFSQIDVYNMSREDRSEVQFKKGYLLFVKKKFRQAKPLFKSLKETENEYYFPSNYYYGVISFFDNDYDEAVKHFNRVSKSKKYKPHIPYYITQIYFAQGEYDKVISYAEPKLKQRSVRNKDKMAHLVGKAYFEGKDYATALPYLEKGASKSKMREEDFFQLGFAQHATGQCEKAIRNFKELSNTDSKIGQNAMYLLGDCEIKIGDKASARNAFSKASRMNYDQEITQEALYNYAKLSYELKFDRDAVNVLQKIPVTSPYHAEAQTMMSNIFLNTRDYERALAIIDKLPSKTPKLRETYQKVSYLRGIQLYKEGNYDQAARFFNQSLETPIDSRTKALAIHWLGSIAHQQKQYDNSILEMNKFISLAKTMRNLPDEASVHTANYTQGYNYLKKKDYQSALGYFQETVAGIRQNRTYIDNVYVTNNVYGDALLRAGDALFKRNQYDQAIRFYNEAVENKYSNYTYALYQKALIRGLTNDITEKIIALESLVDDHPNSAYADNALLQLGITYQEINKLDQAAAPLKRLVEDYRGKSNLINQGLLRLGLISYNQGNLNLALNYYKQVFQNNPTAQEAQAALTALEEIYVDDLGQTDEYFAFLESIPGYDVDTEEKESLDFKAGEAQFENANYQKAIDAYNRYLNRYSNGRYTLKARYHRGESYAALKDYSNALKDYNWIVQKGQSQYYEKALRKAAIIAYNHELNFSLAYDLYTKLEEAATDDAGKYEAQIGALRSAYRFDNKSGMVTMANKVKDNPQASDEQRGTAFFYLGKNDFDNKRYDASLVSFNQVVRLSDDEQTAESRYLIAYIYYLQRDLETAQQITLNANKESSNYPYWVAKSVILLADILAEKGDLFNAQATLEALIENYDEDQELVNIAKKKLENMKKQSAASSRLSDPEDPSTMELIDEDQK